MKLNKVMLLVLVAGMSFAGIVQAVTGRYYIPRIQSIEAMLNGKKTMDYVATKKNLDELRIALKNEAKNSDRYKRFASAEKKFNALPSTRSAASQATSSAAAQALIPLSAADEAEALVAAQGADEDYDRAMVSAGGSAGSGAQGSTAGYMNLKGKSAGHESDGTMVGTSGSAGAEDQGSTSGYMDLKGKSARHESDGTMVMAEDSVGSENEGPMVGHMDTKHTAEKPGSHDTMVIAGGSAGSESRESTYMDIKGKGAADARLAAGDLAEVSAAIERLRQLGQEQKNITNDRKQMDKFLQSAQALLNGINNQLLLKELNQLKENIANPQQWYEWVNDTKERAKSADWTAVKKFIKKARNSAAKFVQDHGGAEIKEADEKNNE